MKRITTSLLAVAAALALAACGDDAEADVRDGNDHVQAAGRDYKEAAKESYEEVRRDFRRDDDDAFDRAEDALDEAKDALEDAKDSRR